MELNKAVSYQHLVWQEQLKDANVIVDATCGNGNDTLYLLEHSKVGAHIYAIDIQEEAIKNTKKRLGYKSDRVHFIQGSHDTVLGSIEEDFDLVVFNLGYLPGEDHRCMTSGDTTVRAIKTVCSKMSVGGIITVIAYPGTAQGMEEKNILELFLQSIPQRKFHCWRTEPMNQVNEPPLLYVVQKRG